MLWSKPIRNITAEVKKKHIFVQKSKEFQAECQSVLRNPRLGPKLARLGPRET